jgi:hypothetical protein
MEDCWPWEARELDPQEPFNEIAFPKHRKGVWLLKTSIIGNYCISHPEGQFFTLVGSNLFRIMFRASFTMTLPNRPNGGELQTTQNSSPTHWPTFLSLESFEQSYRKHRVLRGLYWICGKQAYTVLPSSYLAGSIRPTFFLLPHRQGEKLGVPIYEERLSRQKRGALQIGNWKG